MEMEMKEENMNILSKLVYGENGKNVYKLCLGKRIIRGTREAFNVNWTLKSQGHYNRVLEETNPTKF